MKSFFKEFNKHQSKLTRMYSFRSLLSCKSFPRPQQLGPWFNIKMSSYQYSQSHCGDKTILRPSYLCNGISYTDQGTPGNANLIGRFEKLASPGCAGRSLFRHRSPRLTAHTPAYIMVIITHLNFPQHICARCCNLRSICGRGRFHLAINACDNHVVSLHVQR